MADTIQTPKAPRTKRSKELDPTMRARLCELYSIGWGYRRIHSKYSEIPISTIRNTIKMESKRENQKSLPRKGTPKKLSVEQQRILIEHSDRNPQITMRELQEVIGNVVSKSTIRRMLKDVRQKGGINSNSNVSSSNDINNDRTDNNADSTENPQNGGTGDTIVT